MATKQRPAKGEWAKFKEDRARLEREKEIRGRRAPIYDASPSAPEKAVEAPQRTTRYWIGVRDGSPRDYITLGNVCFPKYTEKVSDPEDGGLVTERTLVRGDVVDLRPEQVRVALERGRDLVVRGRGSASAPPLVLSSRNTSFHSMEADVPLGRYVFMIPIKEAAKLGYDWRDQAEPEPML